MVFEACFSIERCAVFGCLNPVCAKGLCREHYNRNYYSGTPLRRLRTRMCPVCFKWFDPERSSRLFCSDKCRLRYFRKRQLHPELPSRPETVLHERTVEPAERPRMVVESFTRSQVVEKCAGRCQKCGGLVDVDSAGPDGAAFEWKVPLEKSHSATLENRILVHDRCRGEKPVRRTARNGRKRSVNHGRKRA